MLKIRKDVTFPMYFFSGRLGALERMMTEKPGYHRRSGKSGKANPPKKSVPQKPIPRKPAPSDKKKGKDERHDG